ncbi:DUF389 domain-containing protein [Spirosoma sp. BT702]|uniref:DUF389 domain-containing protein n=1 Tax=Spirosoma profusum TaxID=2771354 RepID=A0A926XVE4_9BACT|nr:DUF389 domain-containing protein [Spirosoma profusum]MBD2700585.1 DUF389 domain-containing protein [Spirosoma profusum]
MHRTLTISLPSERTNPLIEQLKPLDAVISISVQWGGSVKPPGNVLILQVLNKGVDESLRQIAAVCAGETYSIATAEQASFIDPQQDKIIGNDVDEAIWEEMETGLRHQSRVTSNYLALMALGGVMSAVGLVSEPVPQVVAFIAASIVAPGFEPIAKIPLGLVLRNLHTIKRGLWSFVSGYGVLILAAALSFALLRWAGVTNVTELTQNQSIKMMSDPSAKDIIVSICGTLSGALIVASYRRSIIAGALIAMVIISAAAMIGAALACGQWELALEGAERFFLDVAFIIVSCLLVFTAKQRFLHKRKPIV